MDRSGRRRSIGWVRLDQHLPTLVLDSFGRVAQKPSHEHVVGRKLRHKRAQATLEPWVLLRSYRRAQYLAVRRETPAGDGEGVHAALAGRASGERALGNAAHERRRYQQEAEALKVVVVARLLCENVQCARISEALPGDDLFLPNVDRLAIQGRKLVLQVRRRFKSVAPDKVRVDAGQR